jgi:hypothetical protein
LSRQVFRLEIGQRQPKGQSVRHLRAVIEEQQPSADSAPRVDENIVEADSVRVLKSGRRSHAVAAITELITTTIRRFSASPAASFSVRGGTGTSR